MKKLFLLSLLTIFIFSCKTAKNVGFQKKSSSEIEVVFLHMNDVYEISPLEGGKVGGMARVATVRQELLQRNPNTITVLSGDFLNPSLIGTMKYEGKSIKGRQMVDVMNSLGVDFVGLGNHEFDLDEAELQARINESKFNWIATNAFQKDIKSMDAVKTEPFGKIVNGTKTPFQKTTILNLKDSQGNLVKVGIFSVLLPSNKKDFVWYDDFFESAKKAYNELKPQCDFVVAITHINKVDDLKMAEMLPEIPLIMGGHDHDNMIYHVGKTTMAKADANAKTVYIHQLLFNKNTKEVKVNSILKPINSDVKEDETVEKVVDKWEEILEASFKKMGLNKDEIVADLKETLDGREVSNRNKQTNLGNVICKSMIAAAKNPVDCAFFNSGSVRIDDELSGKITPVDILRVLPFGGKMLEVKMKGRLLERVLETGLKNKGGGGYLQWDKITYDEVKKEWKINGNLLDVNQDYNVVTSDFLMTGKEANLSFLNRQNPDIQQVTEPDSNDATDVRNDIRKVVITYLKK